MGRNDVTFSDAQRQAIEAAMLEGRSAPDVVAAAAAGELGVPAFKVSETTCRTLRQQVRNDPQRLAALSDRILAMCETLVGEIEKQKRPSNTDVGRLKKLLPLAEHAARAGNTAQQLLRRPGAQAVADTDGTPALLAHLARQAENGERESGRSEAPDLQEGSAGPLTA